LSVTTPRPPATRSRHRYRHWSQVDCGLVPAVAGSAHTRFGSRSSPAVRACTTRAHHAALFITFTDAQCLSQDLAGFFRLSRPPELLDHISTAWLCAHRFRRTRSREAVLPSQHSKNRREQVADEDYHLVLDRAERPGTVAASGRLDPPASRRHEPTSQRRSSNFPVERNQAHILQPEARETFKFAETVVPCTSQEQPPRARKRWW
jgi:hypothetical protein